MKILVCCCGSVAALKLPELVLNLIKDFEIRVVVTDKAKCFFDRNQIPREVNFYDDEDEWGLWKTRGDPVLHIDLGKWADLVVIAPLDANTLAKIATGISDNLLTCILRAWDFSKPVIFCPAMNTRMWNHPITAQHLKTLKDWGFIEVPVISKTLICGDTGLGAMADLETICKVVKNALLNK